MPGRFSIEWLILADGRIEGIGLLCVDAAAG